MPNNKTNQESKSGQTGSQGSQGGKQVGGYGGTSSTGQQGSSGQGTSESGMNDPQHKSQFDKPGSSSGQFGSQNKEDDE